MFFQRVAIVLTMALTTLALSELAGVTPSVCVVYTVVESAFPIEACFSLDTIISVESVTPITISNAPTCVTILATASTTLSSMDILGPNSPPATSNNAPSM